MSKIEWTESTWNPVVGCTRVSAGCDNCYAVKMTYRQEQMAIAAKARGDDPGRSGNYIGLTVLNNRDERHFNGTVRTVEEALTIPLRWKKPRRIFVNSMSDLFHRDVPLEFIDRVFAVMALCPQHTFQVLTKRPERMAEYLGDRTLRLGAGGQLAANPHERVACAASAMISDNDDRQDAAIEWPLPNVWLGTSCEDQATADQRIPHLLRCPAAVRFLSLEPLLGGIDLSAFMGGEYVALPGDRTEPNRNFGIDWCIVGGESGPGARPCNVEWIRSIVSQCKAADVPVFVKQAGSNPVEFCSEPLTGKRFTNGETRTLCYRDNKGGDPAEWPEDLRVRQWPKGAASC